VVDAGQHEATGLECIGAEIDLRGAGQRATGMRALKPDAAARR
jgi:hypothetical protein